MPVALHNKAISEVKGLFESNKVAFEFSPYDDMCDAGFEFKGKNGEEMSVQISFDYVGLNKWEGDGLAHLYTGYYDKRKKNVAELVTNLKAEIAKYL